MPAQNITTDHHQSDRNTRTSKSGPVLAALRPHSRATYEYAGALLSQWPDLKGAWLFGSVARADAGEDSDIDVLLVVDDLESPDLHDRIARIQADAKSWTGNDLQLVEHSAVSWRKLVSAKNPLVAQVRLDGIVLVVHDTSLLERKR